MPRCLVVTAGDPCGIGPEVILRALGRGDSLSRRMRTVVIGDHAVFEKTAAKLRLRLPRWHVLAAPGTPASSKRLSFMDCAHRAVFRPGCSGAGAGRASLRYLAEAIRVLKAAGGALVTAPVTKWAIERICPGFVGQTEYLAKGFGARAVVMLFASPGLRVALLTRHVPLREVARRVDRRLVRTTLALTFQALRRQFGIRHPRVVGGGV
jgi:4-hydroxythreonine-4-phosphate dehydrogenase